MKNKLQIFVLLCIWVMVTSCGQYQKMLKSTDAKLKYEYAENLYAQKDYSRASRILEQIVPLYIGKPQGERVLFMYADALYKQKQYYTAAYQFERFVSRYSNSSKAEQALFLRGKSLYQIVPIYSVDQTLTHQALDVLQSFVDRYTNSDYTSEVNQMIQSLVNQLQKKQFEIAKQYYTIEDYQAAQTAIDNFLLENPGTIFKEEALWIKLQTCYQLAYNSVEYKKQARYQAAKEAYLSLMKAFPKTKYSERAQRILSTIDKQLK